MYYDKLVYKVVIWAFVGVILWKEKQTLNEDNTSKNMWSSNDPLVYI